MENIITALIRLGYSEKEAYKLYSFYAEKGKLEELKQFAKGDNSALPPVRCYIN